MTKENIDILFTIHLHTKEDLMLGAIVDYIIETVQTESQLNGFQYIINYTSIEKILT